MSPLPLVSDPMGPDAEQTNEAIRAFLRARSARGLLPEERVEYARLVGRYLKAVQGELQAVA